MEIGFTALAPLKDTNSSAKKLETARRALLLAATGLDDQGQIYQIPVTVFHVLGNEMNHEDAELTHKLLNVHAEDRLTGQMRAKHVQAQWACNIADITKKPEGQRLSNLIAEYEKLVVKETSSALVD